MTEFLLKRADGRGPNLVVTAFDTTTFRDFQQTAAARWGVPVEYVSFIFAGNVETPERLVIATVGDHTSSLTAFVRPPRPAVGQAAGAATAIVRAPRPAAVNRPNYGTRRSARIAARG
jgi:hypothetical protein